MSIIWILVNCNSAREAERIGNAVLQKRYAACYNFLKREKAAYFWPAQSGKIETVRGGYLLVLETLPPYFKKIRLLVEQLHSDKLPFIGSVKINNVNREFYRWVRSELAV